MKIYISFQCNTINMKVCIYKERRNKDSLILKMNTEI